MQLFDCPTIHRSFMLLISWSFCCHSCRGNQSAPWCPSLVHLDGSLWRRDISLLVQHRAQAICINRVQKQKLFGTKNSLTFDINVSEKLLFLNYVSLTKLCCFPFSILFIECNLCIKCMARESVPSSTLHDNKSR